MGYSQQAKNASSRARVQIMTVDTANRRCEGMQKDGTLLQIALWDHAGNAYRVPQENEIWIICRYQNIWHLDSRVQDGTVVNGVGTPEALPITSMVAGQMKLDSINIVDGDGSPIGGLPMLSPRSFGAGGAGLTDDTAAVQETIAHLPSDGGGIIIDGHFRCTGQLNFDGKRAVVVQGVGGISAGAATRSMLTFAQSGSTSCISARSTFGFSMRDVAVLNTNPSYTGDVIDLSSPVETAFPVLRNMLLFAEPSAARLLNLNNCAAGHYDTVNFNGATLGAQGVLGTAGTNTNYSNGQTFTNCKFGGQVLVPITNPGQGWAFHAPVVEPNTSGEGVFISINASAWAGLSVTGGWLGDANTTGAWIFVNAAGGGLSVTGTEFGAGADALLVNVSTHGLNVTGNKFDFCQFGINLQAGITVTDSIFVNDASTCTTAGVIKGTGVALTRVIITDTKGGTGDIFGFTVH